MSDNLVCPKGLLNIPLGKQCLQVVNSTSSFFDAKKTCLKSSGLVSPPLDIYQNTILR